MEISNHQCPKAVQIGADAINAATWTMLWNMCVARRFPAQPLLMCFMIYVSTDTFYLSASSIEVIFLLMIQSLTPANYRKAAYRQYIMYQHGYLGRSVRKVIPSCVVWKVRDQYPAPDNIYLGFKEY